MNNFGTNKFGKRFPLILLPMVLLFLCSCVSAQSPTPQESSMPSIQPAEDHEKSGDSIQKSSPAEIPSTSDQPMRLTLQDSILMGLENNPEILVQRLTPEINRASEETARSEFDPKLSSSFSYQRTASPGSSGTNRTDQYSGDLALETFLPTGTTIGLTQGNSASDPGNNSTRMGVQVNQSLLQGAGTNVNLASLREANIDTLNSEYELRGYAESLVSNIETAYWNYYVSRLKMQIYTDSLALAKQQLSETEERITIGKLSESELAAAQAEVALRDEELINSRSSMETNHLHLLRLLSPRRVDFWTMEVDLLDKPALPSESFDSAEPFIQTALNRRPDYKQAQLQIQRGDLELVKSRNGLLPKLDLFINLGGTGYARTFTDTYGNLNGDYYDVQTGFSFSYPLFNRSAKARQRTAEINRQQADLSLTNMQQLVQEDVRTAFIEVNRSRQQIDATKATRLSQEEKLRSETEKFRVGKSTSLLVAQAQRDYLSSQIDEVEALTNYSIALIDLYRLDGSLLDRRGLSAQYIESE